MHDAPAILIEIATSIDLPVMADLGSAMSLERIFYKDITLSICCGVEPHQDMNKDCLLLHRTVRSPYLAGRTHVAHVISLHLLVFHMTRMMTMLVAMTTTVMMICVRLFMRSSWRC